jgi:hypothetical protein
VDPWRSEGAGPVECYRQISTRDVRRVVSLPAQHDSSFRERVDPVNLLLTSLGIFLTGAGALPGAIGRLYGTWPPPHTANGSVWAQVSWA